MKCTTETLLKKMTLMMKRIIKEDVRLAITRDAQTQLSMEILLKKVEIIRVSPHRNLFKPKILNRSLMTQLHLVGMIANLANLEIVKEMPYQTQVALHLPQKRRKKNIRTINMIALVAAARKTLKTKK